jgi:hypothetical protein
MGICHASDEEDELGYHDVGKIRWTLKEDGCIDWSEGD